MTSDRDLAQLPQGIEVGQFAPDFEPLLTPTQAAQLLQVHEKSVQSFARSGKLPAVRVGKAWRFRASALDAWVNSALQSDIQSRRES